MSGATIFEEHSEVLAHWFGSGVRGATLIYLDAHLDLQFVDPARIAGHNPTRSEQVSAIRRRVRTPFKMNSA